MNILVTQNFNFTKKDLEEFDKFRKKFFHPKSDNPIKGETLKALRNQKKLLGIKDINILLEPLIKRKVIKASPLEVKSTYNVLFKIKIGKKSFILKINILPKPKIDFTLILEEKFQNLLKKIRLPSIKSIVGENFLIMDLAKGKTIDLQKSVKNIYIDLGKKFKKIHKIKAKGAGLISIKKCVSENKLEGLSSSWQKYFNINFESHLRKSVKLKVLNKKDISFLRSMTKKYIVKAINTNSLLHNDPSSRNIFFSKGKITSLLDWEDAIIGDSLFEIANVHTFLFRDEDKEKFKLFCLGYTVKQKIIFSNPLYWIYYTRIALFKTITRNRDGYYNEMGFKIDKFRVEKGLTELRAAIGLE